MRMSINVLAVGKEINHRANARYIVLGLLLLLVMSVKAQFDPQIGQYMYLPAAYNPATVGEGDLLKVAGLHRMQWTGIEGAPMSTYFTFGSPFEIGKTKHGAGVRFLNDRYGLWTNQTFHIQYAYRQKLGKGTLSVGLDLGFINVSFHGDSVNLSDLGESEYHTPGDEAIPMGEATGMSFDMGAGLYYRTSRWYVGASYSHILQPAVELTTQTATVPNTLHVRGTMYVHGGYKIRLRNRDFVLIPSALLQTDFRSWDADVSLMTEYLEKYRWGLSYRVLGGVGILLGVEIFNGFDLGYTYELPTSKLMVESFGSHEIYLSYSLDILRPKRTNQYKSVRFL